MMQEYFKRIGKDLTISQEIVLQFEEALRQAGAEGALLADHADAHVFEERMGARATLVQHVVGQHEIPGADILREAAGRREGDDPFHAEVLEGP